VPVALGPELARAEFSETAMKSSGEGEEQGIVHAATRTVRYPQGDQPVTSNSFVILAMAALILF